MANLSKQIKVVFQGTEKTILGEIIDQKFWCYYDGEIFAFETNDLNPQSISKRKTKSNTMSAELITAPMPGKITKIFVKEGQVILKSQPLLVMEAMKMEYTLKSDLDTTVEKINVQLDQQVTLGQMLIHLVPQKTTGLGV